MTFLRGLGVLAPGANPGAVMAKSPEDGHYPQTAQRARLPASMVNALRVIYAGAGIAVVLGVTIALTTHSRTLHMGDPAAGTYKAGYVTGGAITGLIAAGLWLWMAWANKRGRSWARILSTVFFGVLTLYAAAGLVALPAAAKIAVLLEWAAGLAAVVFLWQRQSSLYYQTVSRPAGHARVLGPGSTVSSPASAHHAWPAGWAKPAAASRRGG